MVRATAVIVTIAKILPLAALFRGACCKYELPILGCDAPLCPLAIGQPATDGCSPTGNTAEVKAWCEHGWTPWLNQILETIHVPKDVFVATCDEATGFQLLKMLGAMEFVGYALLWVMPQFGGFFFTVFMAFALHFHLTFLKDPPAALGLQISLFAASVVVFLFGGSSPPATKTKSH